MGCNVNKEENIIWIDSMVNNKENSKYVDKLKQNISLKTIKCTDKVSDAIEFMKKINFERTMIICSGKLYPEFIREFKEKINEFKICPGIIILKKKKKSYLDRNINDNELSINHPFYNSGGVVDQFDDLLCFLVKNPINEDDIKIEENQKRNENEVEFNFEYIKKKNQLILPINFLNYCKNFDKKEIKEFNRRIFDKYRNTSIEPLFKQLLKFDYIPNNIISKFWVRAYTANCDFYKNMNKDLRLSNSDDYLIYIQMMYEGVRIKSFIFEPISELYRGTKFDKKEIEELEKYFKNKKLIEGLDLPLSIVYSKSFFSFSSNRNKAEEFKKNALLILNNLNIDSSPGCACIKDFSFFKNENEVLVFPFSCFVIKRIEKIKDNDYEIFLDYLGKYQGLFKGKSLEELFKEVPRDSKFVKDLFSSNILKKKYELLKTIILKYKIDKENDKIRIFGKNFVNFNKDHCFLMHGKKEFKLKEFFYLKYLNKNNIDELEIRLIITGNVTNLAYMFESTNLLSIDDNLYYKENDITNMSNMFSNCTYLISIEAISKWEISNVKDISYLFTNCNNLESLPDISSWNVSNVSNMSYMFYNCSSLKNLPDISQWNVSNASNMSYMFYNCSSLTKLPDISQWNVSNVSNMSYMFYNCYSLIKFPDISNWNASSVENMDYLFYKCKQNSLPNISKWDISKLTRAYNIIEGYSSFFQLGNIFHFSNGKKI